MHPALPGTHTAGRWRVRAAEVPQGPMPPSSRGAGGEVTKAHGLAAGCPLACWAWPVLPCLALPKPDAPLVHALGFTATALRQECSCFGFHFLNREKFTVSLFLKTEH